MFNPEILAPGGSFNSAMHAYEAGAHAVYIGLNSFSARKSAKNFSLESLRRLKSYASKNDKRIYVAINTVIKDSELKELIAILHHLSLIAVDAIILQDMGLAYIIKDYFPELEIHASTQLAVHNSHGVSMLKNEGFSRIILSRELTFEEIKIIREEHDDIELEVFIHGAQCYSFSGLCLASGKMLGRSGNRGECGQICRTWFESEKGNKYLFSANDLKLGSHIKELQKIKIDSLKIEGRLKNPSYVFHTVNYYKSILDGKNQNHIKEQGSLSALAFSRDQSSSFFTNAKGENMINNLHTSHNGIRAGKIISVNSNSFTLKSEIDLSDRDGLFVQDDGKPEQFALKSDGKRNHYKKGELIKIISKKKYILNQIVNKVSAHDMHLKEFKEESWKSWKSKILVKVTILEESIKIDTELFSQTIHYEEKIAMEESNGSQSIKEVLEKNLSKGGLDDYGLLVSSFSNESNFSGQNIYIALSAIKALKKTYLAFIGEKIRSLISERNETILKEIQKDFEDSNHQKSEDLRIPPRKEMNPNQDLIPFVQGKIQSDSKLIYYPLPPLLFHYKDFTFHMNQIKDLLCKQNSKVIIGLNNISHLYFVDQFGEKEEVNFFTDYCTYIANRASALFFRKRVEKLLFSFYWIEDEKGSLEGIRPIEKEFEPHLFVSRICYKKHNQIGPCKNCSKDLSYELNQRDKEFSVLVKDCVTWLF